MANPHHALGFVIISKRGSVWSLKEDTEGGRIRLLSASDMSKALHEPSQCLYPQALLHYYFCRSGLHENP